MGVVDEADQSGVVGRLGEVDVSRPLRVDVAVDVVAKNHAADGDGGGGYPNPEGTSADAARGVSVFLDDQVFEHDALGMSAAPVDQYHRGPTSAAAAAGDGAPDPVKAGVTPKQRSARVIHDHARHADVGQQRTNSIGGASHRDGAPEKGS